jgi:TetR/AcrR family transcriptional regulator
MRADGDPASEISAYAQRKLEMARDLPRESRLFANELLRGAPHIIDLLEGALKDLVDEKAAIIGGWMAEGRLIAVDPHHLLFAIWGTTQHYADFDVQVRATLGPGRDGDDRFDVAARMVEQLFVRGLQP